MLPAVLFREVVLYRCHCRGLCRGLWGHGLVGSVLDRRGEIHGLGRVLVGLCRRRNGLDEVGGEFDSVLGPMTAVVVVGLLTFCCGARM